MTQLGEAFVPVRATLDKLDQDLAAAKGKIDGALGSIGSGVQALGGLALGGIALGITAVGVALAGIGGFAFNAGMMVDEAMDTIAIKSGATEEVLDGLRGSFEEVFTSVPTDAGTAAGVIGTLNSRLGLTGDALNTLAVPLAQVTELIGGDAVARTELFTRVMGDWGVEVDAAPALLDSFFAASQATGAGMDDLMAKVVQFGSPLRLMGFGLEESVALFAKWEQEGVNSELVMGSLRIAAGEFARENIPLRDGLMDTMDAIKGAGSESEALAIAMDVFGARAGPDMAAAILEGRFSIEDLIATMEDSEGAIGDTTAATADWPEMWTLIKNKATLALAPIGAMLMDLAGRVMPLVEGGFAWFEVTLLPILENVAQVIGEVLGGFIDNLQSGMGPLDAFVGAIEGLVPPEVFEFLVRLKDEILPGLISWFQESVMPIVETITQFVSWKDVLMALGVAIASVVIPAIASILGAVLPVIAVAVGLVALFAVVRNAWENDWGGIRTALTEAWEQKIKPALEQLWQWLKVNIPIALETLKGFWESVLLPAIQNVWAWISGTLIPFLSGTVVPILETVLTVALQALADYWTEILWPAIQNVWAWISGTLIPFITGTLVPTIDTILTVALTTLADFWENVLLPAIETVWAFIRDDLVPLFEAVRELVAVAMTLALTALQGAWENILLPALEVVWEFIQENLVPIIERLIEVLGPPIQTVIGTVKGLFDDFKGALDGVKGLIQDVIGFINDLIAALGNIELPDILTPGSPTPFELGLRGIVGAMRDMNQLLPELERRLQMGGLNWAASVSADELASPSAGSAGGDTYHLTLAGAAGESRGLMRDFAMLKWLAGTD